MTDYRQQILPEIAQRFVSADAGSSSALNQALSQSAGNLANTLAGQRLGAQQRTGQQQLGALGQLGQLQGRQTFAPMMQNPKEGILGNILSLIGTLGGGYLGGVPGAAAGKALAGALTPQQTNTTALGSYTPIDQLRG